jgi:ABC-type transporter Mla subunit MlaD
MAITVKLAGTTVAPGNYDRLIETDPPKPVAIADAINEGSSTVSQISRGFISNTSIAISNAEIWHICDPKSEVALYLATKSAEIAQAIQKARDALIKALFGDTTSPALTAIKALIKDAIALLKRINKILKAINKAIQTAKEVIADINAFINIIKTLPQRIAQTLQQCLVLLQQTLAKALTIGLGDLGTIIQQTNLAISQTNQAVSGVKGLGNDLNGLATNLASVPTALSAGIKSASTSLSTSVTNFADNVSKISANINQGNGTAFVQISNSRP